jgi:hypothetical protein
MKEACKALGKRVATILASGYVLMFFSEFYFLNEGPGAEFAKHWSEDPRGLLPWLGEFALIYYASWGFIMLAAISKFRVRDFWSFFIAAALFGWAVEGILIPVIYEDLPWSIGWPSLGWHVLVDAMLGWYAVRWVLQKNNYFYTTLMAIGLGLFWGVWCTWYWVEIPPPGEEALPPLAAEVFPAYTLTLGALLIAAYIVLEKLGAREFKPSWVEIGLFALWHVFCFVLMASAVPVAYFILPSLFAAAFLLLWWNRRHERRPDLFSMLGAPIGWGHYLLLLLMPICAIPVYLLLFHKNIHLPVLSFVGAPLMWIGNGLLFVSAVAVVWRGCRARATTPTEAAPEETSSSLSL